MSTQPRTTTLVIPGKRETAPASTIRGVAPTTGDAKPVTDLLDAVQVVDAFSLSAPARAQTVAPAKVDVPEDDILEIEVEGGFTLWTSVARYQDDLAVLKPDQVKPTAAHGRHAAAGERLRTRHQGLGRERAACAAACEDRIQGEFEDPSQWPADFLQEFGVSKVADLSAWLATKLIMRLIEKQLDPGPGLYRWATVRPTSRSS